MCAEVCSYGLTSWLLPLEDEEVCLQLLLLCVSKSTPTGYEATVSHRTPVLHSFCLASALKRSISVPHLGPSALLQCAVSYQLVRKPSSRGFLSCPFIEGVGPQPSLNIFNGICLCFGLYLEPVFAAAIETNSGIILDLWPLRVCVGHSVWLHSNTRRLIL